MCKDDPFNHIALQFSNDDQYHHQYRWLTFGFPATDDIGHMICLLFAFEYVPHMGRSQQIKYLRLHFWSLTKEWVILHDFVDLYRGSSCLRNVIFTLIPSVNILRMMVIVVIMKQIVLPLYSWRITNIVYIRNIMFYVLCCLASQPGSWKDQQAMHNISWQAYTN